MPAPKVITLAPTALDRNGISASETLAAARLSLIIGGALSAGFDRDGICASQTPTGANAMTLNGALGVDLQIVKAYMFLYMLEAMSQVGHLLLLARMQMAIE